MKFILMLFGLFFSLCMPVEAEQKEAVGEKPPEKIGEFGDWRAFVSRKGGEKTCYMVSFPLEQKGHYKKRGKPYLMITHRPKNKSYNVLSVYGGYKFSKDRKPRIVITTGETKKEFELFVEGEFAWAPSDEIDQALTKMITRKGEGLSVKGESFKGTKTTDTYSLKGSFAAYKAICQKCSLKVE